MHMTHFASIRLLICLVAVFPTGCAIWTTDTADDEGYATAHTRAEDRTGDQSSDRSNDRSKDRSDDRVDNQSNVRVDDRSNSWVDELALERIAVDFVNALEQMPPLQPGSTTVHLLRSAGSDGFTRQMRDALLDAGYGIRWVDDNASEHLFQYRYEREAGDAQLHRDLYEVAVGQIELRRSYETDAQARVSPVTPLYVRGTDARHVLLDDAHFQLPPGTRRQPDRRNISQPVPVTPQESRRAGLATTSAARSGAAALSVPAEANPLDARISGAGHVTGRGKGLSLPLVALPRVENVFELGGSNYQQTLASHRVIRKQVLTFPNDSLRLGEVNKRFIEQMVVDFQPHTDVFSVIGCSLGPTKLKSGNAALALGRASRVREALLFAGVPQNRILDEGCWAGDSRDDSLPRRGVVVTLNRRP